jgi:hypothetical protein
MEKLRKNVKVKDLVDKKLSQILVDLGFQKTKYRTLIWDINDNLVGVVKRNGQVVLFDKNEAEKIIQALNKGI